MFNRSAPNVCIANIAEFPSEDGFSCQKRGCRHDRVPSFSRERVPDRESECRKGSKKRPARTKCKRFLAMNEHQRTQNQYRHASGGKCFGLMTREGWNALRCIGSHSCQSPPQALLDHLGERPPPPNHLRPAGHARGNCPSHCTVVCKLGSCPLPFTAGAPGAMRAVHRLALQTVITPGFPTQRYNF